MEKNKLFVLIGPTAVGKTALSIDIAKKIGGEIISGDSMQVYRGMDIGTAKITRDEMQGIPHYMIDILNPDEDFSVSQFKQLASETIEQICHRGNIPMLVGGTGLYVQSVTHDFQFAHSGEDSEIRSKWQHFFDEHGADALYTELQKVDPGYAVTVHPNNIRRVIRALEVNERTGASMLNYQQDWDNDSPYDLIMVGLTMERERLYERINYRVDLMIEQGLIEEVKHILQQGIPPTATSLQAIGYKEIVQYIQGELSKEEAIQLLKRNTRRFAKRQLTWFRRMEEIHWFDVTHIKSMKTISENIVHLMAGEWKTMKNR